MIRLNASGDLVRVGAEFDLGATGNAPNPRIEHVLATAAELKAALAEAGMVLMPIEPPVEVLGAMAAYYDPAWGYSDRMVAGIWARASYSAAIREYAALKEAE